MPGPAPIVACFIREGVCMCCVYPVCPVYTNSIRLYSSHCTVGKSWDSWESYFLFTINFHTLECFKYSMGKKNVDVDGRQSLSCVYFLCLYLYCEHSDMINHSALSFPYNNKWTTIHRQRRQS